MLARVIEATGIPTVTVSMMPELSSKHRSSRILGVEYPFGHAFGVAGDTAMQTRTLRAALELLDGATEPETRLDLEEAWPIDRKTAYKAWQPAEPSPIVAMLIRQQRAERQARGG